MAAARLAPVLSATSKMERICNINPQLGRHRGDFRAALEDLNQSPPLGLGERPGLLNQNPIAYLGFGFLVVDIKLFVASYHFLKARVGEPALDTHNDGFGHLVGDDFPNAFLSLGALGSVGWRCGWCGLSHIRNLKRLSYAVGTSA